MKNSMLGSKPLKYFHHHQYYNKIIKSKLSLISQRKHYKSLFAPYHHFFDQKYGLEIGGPSSLFSTNFLPIYKLANSIDGCNFSAETIWEGIISSDNYRYYTGKVGHQYITEGSVLPQIKNNTYNFILSCHSLEHFANPLRAFQEWNRVLKKTGVIFLVTPDKRFTFDRNRDYTTIEHLIEDYNTNVNEDDTTHLHEILEKHDLKYDPRAPMRLSDFETRCKENLKNRCMHHHVFDFDLLTKFVEQVKMRVLEQYLIPPYNQIIIAIKDFD